MKTLGQIAFEAGMSAAELEKHPWENTPGWLKAQCECQAKAVGDEILLRLAKHGPIPADWFAVRPWEDKPLAYGTGKPLPPNPEVTA